MKRKEFDESLKILLKTKKPNTMNTQSKETGVFSSLFEQAAQISKAHAYDILVKQVGELKAENEALQEAKRGLLEALENVVGEYKSMAINYGGYTSPEGGKAHWSKIASLSSTIELIKKRVIAA